MTRCQYTTEFKSKVVLNILQGSQELNGICAQHNLNPNMVRKWKQEFLQNNKVRPHEALSYRTPDSYYYGQNVA